MGYRALTSAILAVHFAYLAYVVLGGFLAWRWPRTIWVHLAAALWGLIAITFPTVCPLTDAEDWSRRQAGEAGLTTGFIDRYIEGVLYPERYTRLLQVVAALTILVSYAGFILLRAGRRRRPPAHR